MAELALPGDVKRLPSQCQLLKAAYRRHMNYRSLLLAIFNQAVALLGP